MQLFHANLVANVAIAAIIGFCTLGTGFMLYFLHALTKDRKKNVVGYRWECRINSPVLDTGVRRRREPRYRQSASPFKQTETSGGALEKSFQPRVEESMLTHEYGLASPRREPDGARFHLDSLKGIPGVFKKESNYSDC
jgi:hypothetical protein